jgi:hypothetical protein
VGVARFFRLGCQIPIIVLLALLVP